MAMKTIDIKVGNQIVKANLYSPESNPKNVGVLFLHGWTGKPNELAGEFLAEKGFHALTIKMRGHGNSDGDIKKVTARDSLQDAIAAYDFLISQLPKGSQLYAVGNSYGAYIAVILSSERRLAGISLRVPANYPDDLYGLPKWGRGNDDPAVDKWRHKPCSAEQNRALNLVHNFKGKVQILEAEKDLIIPHQTVQNYVEAVFGESRLDYHLLMGWEHSMGLDPVRNKQLQELLLSWLNS